MLLFAPHRLLAGTAAVSLALTGCGSSETASTGDPTASGDAGSANLSVTFLPKNLGNPYFDASSTGGKAAIEALGGTFNEVGPATATADAQVDMIAEQIGDEGQIAILSASANATNQNAWIEDMKSQLEADHPNIELVEVAYGDDDDQTSFDKTAALLQTYPDLKGIVSPTTVGIAAAARYVSTSSFKGKVAVTGLGTPNQMRESVKDGTVTEFALWNPQDLGTLSAYAAAALIKGDITGAEGDYFDAGDLGSFTVGADQTVLLGDPYRFNADNIDDFDF